MKLIIAFISMLYLSGCAFGTRQPLLIYPPDKQSDESIAIAHPAVTQTSKNITFILLPLTDQRTDKKLVGTVRNGYGMRTADVIPINDVPEWLNQAIRTELEKNGYTVISGESPDILTGNSPIISGDITNVFCDMYLTYSGAVSFVVRVKQNGKEILNKHYLGEGSVGLAWAATENSYAQSLALALSDALKKFIYDLNHTNMDKTPEGSLNKVKDKKIKISTVEKAAFEPVHRVVPKNTYTKTYPLSDWNGKWTGSRDAGTIGHCGGYQQQEINTKITNGKVYIKQFSYQEFWGGERSASETRNLKGSINESSEIIVDRGDKYLKEHYIFTGSYNEKKQRLQGVWVHDECKGEWWLSRS